MNNCFMCGIVKLQLIIALIIGVFYWVFSY